SDGSAYYKRENQEICTTEDGSLISIEQIPMAHALCGMFYYAVEAKDDWDADVDFVLNAQDRGCAQGWIRGNDSICGTLYNDGSVFCFDEDGDCLDPEEANEEYGEELKDGGLYVDPDFGDDIEPLDADSEEGKEAIAKLMKHMWKTKNKEGLKKWPENLLKNVDVDDPSINWANRG
ncbi:MAG: hypothetical protein ACRD8U_20100, partial [Pyrinomonadaceae bacterium]